ncbi:MAG: aldo/keto reductase [Candidatus Brockarchaeota archaeon]|nr:aldo/keto reductase [Candidatus Brockarchaeota archaeon]
MDKINSRLRVVLNMEYRRLGRTGFKISILAIGGCGPGIAPNPEEGFRAFENALEKGINIVDVAPSYGEAEIRLGPLISRNRNRLVITEKTLERTREGAWRELRQTLSRLKVEHLDIYQFHAVSTLEELERIFSEDGALKAFLEAREQGLIRYIGITAHSDMRIVVKALERFDFDTVLIPVNVGSIIHPAPENDFKPILKIANERNIGVIAIKAIARGRWSVDRKYQTWYEPLEEQEDIDKAVWFTLSQDQVSTYSMACDIRLWPKIMNAGERFRKLSLEEQERVVNYFREKGIKPLFPD